MYVLILSSLLLVMSTACTSKKIRNEVKQEVAVAPVVKTDSELYAYENKVLLSNEKLTPEQRNKITQLIQKTRHQNSAIDDEIMKTKTVLFKSLIADESNKIKLNVLESQLIKLNRKKIRNSLSAYREAKNIVGKSDVPLEKTLHMIDNRTIHDL